MHTGKGTIFSIPLSDKISIEKEEYSIESLTIDILKKYIWEREEKNLKFTDNASELELWHVNVEEVVDQWLTDISRDIATLGYLPRQDGRGGTRLVKIDQDAYTAEGISLTDPDVNKRPDLVSRLAKSLMEKRVLLVQAPPYSGKTSLSQLLEDYLINSSNLRVIRISLLWGSSVGIRCEYDTFGEVWKNIVGVEWYEWVGQCEKIQTVLIIDETQLIYKNEKQNQADVSMKYAGNAADFWDIVKLCFQGINLHVIMFAAYGYGPNSAGLSTPVHIPPKNSIGLAEIKFTDEVLETYVKDYCVKNFGLSSNDSCIIPRFISYIKYATAGHVGFVRHILQYTMDALQNKIRKEELIWKDIYKYLNSHNFDQGINNCRATPKFDKLSRKRQKICESVYLNGSIIFSANCDNEYLVKYGVFVDNVIDNIDRLCFAAPLLERSFFQQYYESKIRASSTPDSLYEFIVKTITIICNESSEILKYSLGYGNNKILLEQTWQKEFYRIGTRALGNQYFLSWSHLGSSEFIDFYIGGKEWAIELLREGSDMDKHNRRFDETGKYKEIADVAKEIAIIDIRSESKKIRDLKERFIHVSYSDNYDAFMIECLGKETKKIKIKKI
ncbi:unnamed protein product [Rhizophagus irregularis]|nr:unnamed protein product [Rhizophagus irregularis]